MRIDVVCRTAGCQNENVHIALDVPEDCGRVVCGACAHTVTEDPASLKVQVNQ